MEIVRPVTDLDLKGINFSAMRPCFFGRTIDVTSTQITFDGYFHYEAELFSKENPVRRFVKFQGHTYVLGFTAKREGEDTSGYFYDEELGAKICLTPMAIIELDYVVIEKDPTQDLWPAIIASILRQNDRLDEANKQLIRERMEREWHERQEMWANTHCREK